MDSLHLNSTKNATIKLVRWPLSRLTLIKYLEVMQLFHGIHPQHTARMILRNHLSISWITMINFQRWFIHNMPSINHLLMVQLLVEVMIFILSIIQMSVDHLIQILDTHIHILHTLTTRIKQKSGSQEASTLKFDNYKSGSLFSVKNVQNDWLNTTTYFINLIFLNMLN